MKILGIEISDDRDEITKERDMMDRMADAAGVLKHIPLIGDTYAGIQEKCWDRSLYLSGKIIQEMQGSPWNPAERWPTDEEIAEMERRHRLEE